MVVFDPTAEVIKDVNSEDNRGSAVEEGRGPHQPKGGMFVNAGEMKEKMRAQLAKPNYDVRNFYKKHGLAQSIARSPMFDRASLCVIGFNAFWIAVDTDYNDSSVLTDADWPFQVADNFFCFFFLIEWGVRFCAFNAKRDGLRDAWFVFDGLMVLLMVLETWVMTFVLWVAGIDGATMGSTGVLKLVRMTRLTRMARMARLLRAMPELLVLLKGMWAATRSVFFTLLLLFIIIYVFGIAFTQIAGGSHAGDKYFDNVPESMHTLLLRGTLMDDMGPVIRALDKSTGFHIMPIIFYFFLLISSLTVMNMLIGVLCEVVAAVAATEKEESSVAFVKWQIRDIMRKGGLDLDGDGMISKGEFVQILDNPVATRTLSNAGVDVFGLVDCADFIFEGEDVGEAGLSFADFMEVVLQLRGSNVATVKDIVDLRKFVSVEVKKLHENMARLTSRVLRLTEGPEVAPADDTWQRQFSPLPRQMSPSEEKATQMSPRQVFHQDTTKRTNNSQTRELICVAPKVLELPTEGNHVQAEPPSQSRDNVQRREAPASYLPSLDIADSPARADAIAANLDQVCVELDQLRHYVDMELDSIMLDIKKKAQDWPGALRQSLLASVNGDAASKSPGIDPLSSNSLQKPDGSQLLQLREALPSWHSSCSAGKGNSICGPGAELRSGDPSQRRGVSCGVPL